MDIGWSIHCHWNLCSHHLLRFCWSPSEVMG